MRILGSTLSISQRSLLPEHQPSPEQEEAQSLAHNLIQNYSALHVSSEAIAFAQRRAECEPSPSRDSLIFPLTDDPLVPFQIPPGYGVKGGVAREVLAATLRLRPPREPRDVDLIRKGRHPIPTDEEVARRLMPRDFLHGARVELIREMSGYLSSRDVTINELAVVDAHLTASLVCILDSIGGVLRPSRYRGGTLHRKPSVSGQSLLKMVRLYAEGACAGESWTLMGIPDEVTFSEFDLAIHLNKSFQRSRAVAERFLHTCTLLSLIPASADLLGDTLDELEHLRHGERGLFPDVPANEWRSR